MKFKILTPMTLFLSLVFSFSAHAENESDTNGSEFLYQPPAGIFAVRPRIIGIQTDVDYKAGSLTPDISKSRSTAIVLGASFGYGLSEMAAVNLDVGTANFSNSFDCSNSSCTGSKTSAGATDPVLGIPLDAPVATRFNSF
jgi:hypothetical protein